MKQPPHKCLAAWFLALIMALTMLPVGVLALEEADDGAPAEAGELSLPDEEVPSISVEITETVAPAVGSQSDAELLEGYLYAISGLRRGSPVHRVPPRPLTVELKDVENELKGKIRKVAAGDLASTQFSFANIWTKTKEGWGIASDDPVISGGALTSTAEKAIKAKLGLGALMQKQLLEMPYELYWYNKTKGVSMGYSIGTSGDNVTVCNLTLSMNVSQDYAKFIDATSYNPFEADTAKTKAVAGTPEKAQARPIIRSSCRTVSTSRVRWTTIVALREAASPTATRGSSSTCSMASPTPTWSARATPRRSSTCAI